MSRSPVPPSFSVGLISWKVALRFTFFTTTTTITTNTKVLEQPTGIAITEREREREGESNKNLRIELIGELHHTQKYRQSMTACEYSFTFMEISSKKEVDK